MEIPSTVSELTPSWTTSEMRASGQLSHRATVTGIEVEPLGGGLAMSGVTCRVRLSYGEGGDTGPATAIAKFCATEPVMKGLLESLDAYAREIAFYRDLSGGMPIRVPAFFGGGYDPIKGEAVNAFAGQVVDRLPPRAQLAITKDVTKFLRPSSRRYALLIEDMGDATVHDLVNPPDAPDLVLPLRSLAKVHAAYWGKASLLDHPATRTLITSTPRLYRNVYYGRVMALAKERWDWLNNEHLAIIDAAMSSFERDLAAINQPRTLVHGDPRSDNMLFSNGEVVLVDWALTSYAHPGFDVGYLLGSGLEVPGPKGKSGDGGETARELTGQYREALAQGGRELTFDEIWQVAHSAARTLLVQQMMGMPYPVANYGEHGRGEDHWVPRLLSFLSAP